MKVNPVATQAAQPAQQKQPPAQAARDLLAKQPELADQPFGKLVSMFAKGEEVPSGS